MEYGNVPTREQDLLNKINENLPSRLFLYLPTQPAGQSPAVASNEGDATNIK